METLPLSSVRNHLNIRREKLARAAQHIHEPSKLINLIKQVDAALEKLDIGTYGICEICQSSIEEERLMADPLVTVCLDCLSEKQQRALESDLEFAAQIQRNLLPKNNLNINGWEFSYHYNPAGPVSGDFTDIIPLNNDSVLFLIGDVSGKGIAASLMMSQLHGLIHTLLSFGLPVNEIVQKANRLFCESTLYANYATMVIGKAFSNGNIEISVAGHNPPLLIQNGKIATINASGVPVGLFSDSEYRSEKYSLSKGDSILLYTDGITESTFNEVEYGEHRLTAQFLNSYSAEPKSIINELVKDHKSYIGDSPVIDDQTLLVIKKA